MSPTSLIRISIKRNPADFVILAILAVTTSLPWLLFALGPVSPQNFLFGSRPVAAQIFGVPIPPSGGLAGYVGIALTYTIVLLWFVFGKETVESPVALVMAFALILAGFIAALAAIYVQLSHDSSASCFGAPITKLDAIYFTLGTLSTAGTGNLTVLSEQCRAVVSAQLVAGFVIVSTGVAGLVSRLMAQSSPARIG